MLAPIGQKRCVAYRSGGGDSVVMLYMRLCAQSLLWQSECEHLIASLNHEGRAVTAIFQSHPFGGRGGRIWRKKSIVPPPKPPDMSHVFLYSHPVSRLSHTTTPPHRVDPRIVWRLTLVSSFPREFSLELSGRKNKMGNVKWRRLKKKSLKARTWLQRVWARIKSQLVHVVSRVGRNEEISTKRNEHVI